MISLAPAWLASFKQTVLVYLLDKFGGQKSFGNGDVNSWINCYINIPKKTEPPVLGLPYWEIFKIRNMDLPFRRLGNVSAREETFSAREENERQLLSAMLYQQKQNARKVGKKLLGLL